MARYPLPLLPTLAWSALCLQGALAATPCPNTGLVHPDVPTLLASPEGRPWVVKPDCGFFEPNDNRGNVKIFAGDVERVAGLFRLTSLEIVDNPLSLGGDFSNVTDALLIEKFSPKMLNNIKLSSTNRIHLTDSSFTSISSMSFSEGPKRLELKSTQLKSLKGARLPSSLERLLVSSSKISTIDLEFPASLQMLEISSSTMTKIQNVVFPDSIRSLEFAKNQISVVKGVTWPKLLTNLGFEGNPITEFEIRKSDIAIFELLTTFVGDFSLVSCTDSTAERVQVKAKTVCVISDERFESLYRSTATGVAPVGSETTPRRNSTDPTALTSSDETSSDNQDTSDTTESSMESSGKNSGSTEGSMSNGGTTGSAQTAPVASAQPGSAEDGNGGQSSIKTTVIETESSSNGTLVVALAVIGGLITIVVGGWVYRSRMSSRRRQDTDDTKYNSVATPGGPSTGPASSDTVANVLSEEYLVNDVRNDPAMDCFRINRKAVKLNRQIAQGGYGVIYRAIYEDTDVAVKQMLPGAWQDNSALASFMDEIRLCASFSHPKIVAFVGIAYTSLRDLSVVIEYMPGGDLHGLLEKEQGNPRSPCDWSKPWTASQLKSKASIGHDVAEAVAYLHGLAAPVLHRDLKARNVLLDLKGNAKLSDFGVSRELVVDTTMTGEIGTAAWIAPEVLRGARYSEKADIYSLGVLLVELDRCQHPYADESSLQLGVGSAQGIASAKSTNAAQKNMQIAVLVSTGKLRPSVSSECPENVATLVSKCLNFDPSDRPTAEDVARMLSEIAHD